MCGHAKNKMHIGKSECGWSFSFRGYDDQYDDDSEGLTIKSYADWLGILEKPSSTIVDENNDIITLKDFKEMIEHKRADKNHARIFMGIPPYNLKEKEYMESSSYRNPAHERTHHCWIDDEGNSFSGTWFR